MRGYSSKHLSCFVLQALLLFSSQIPLVSSLSDKHSDISSISVDSEADLSRPFPRVFVYPDSVLPDPQRDSAKAVRYFIERRYNRLRAEGDETGAHDSIKTNEADSYTGLNAVDKSIGSSKTESASV